MLFQYRHKGFRLKINKKIYQLVTNNQGFTLIESTLTLFVSTVVLMFLPIILITIQAVNYQFNDINTTNYLLFHQQLMTLYDKSEQVIIKGDHIYFMMPNQRQHEIIIFSDKIVKKTKHHHEFKGYSPMLLHIKNKLMATNGGLQLTIQQGRYQYEIKLTNKKKSSR